VEETLQQIEGMFAFALWDTQTQALYLARDRIGEKPVYYGWQNGNFLFGSELKALKAHPAFEGAIHRAALELFFRYNYVPGPYSIYEGIHKLPPGSFLKLDRASQASRHSPAPTSYWSLTRVAEDGIHHHFAGNEAQALDALEGKLMSAVSDQMLSDVPLGFLLSGGIDSSLVCALAQQASAQPIRTFSVGFEDKAYDEAAYAHKVAAHLGSAHTKLLVNPADALNLVGKLPAIYDEPFADSSQLPTYLVMHLVKQHVAVALSGDGGDELFAGYNRYRYAPRAWRWLSRLPAPARRLAAGFLTSPPAAALNRFSDTLGIAQFGDKAHKLGQRMLHVRDIDDFYVALISEWTDVRGLVLDTGRAVTILDDRLNWPRSDSPVERMMVLDGLTYLPDDILVKVDRAAMAVSLETRAPFLDRNVVEFAWELPLDLKMRDGQTKYLLRKLLQRYLPVTLFNRPKMGFAIPLDQWLRGPLREWAEALLNVDRIKREGYLNHEPIRQAWKNHTSGKGNFGYRLWSVLMFQLWLEQQNV